MDNGQSLEEKAAAAVGTKPSFPGQVAHYSVSLPSGFYAFETYYNFGGYSSKDFTGRITFQTDPWACPYDPDFADYYANFQGCSPKTAH
jgi:hypothetical protein